MPTIQELGSQLNLPLEKVRRLGESQVTNPNSAIYQTVRTRVVAAFMAMKMAEKSSPAMRKPRVYIASALDASSTYALDAAFRGLDTQYKKTKLENAALARTVANMTVESIVARLRLNRGTLAFYGVSLESIVLRGKRYAHLCVPAHDAKAQAAHVESHTLIHGITVSTMVKNTVPGAAREYIRGEFQPACMSPHTCDVKASVGVLMLHGTDTNFRQVAYYMSRKSMKLAYICFFANKHMELCTYGTHELGGCVVPSEDGKNISLIFEGASSYSATVLHANYLELVARTHVTVSGVVYHKEFDSMNMGMAVYKITAVPQADVKVPIYRSWVEPKYRDKYMIYAPMLVPDGSVDRKEDWVMLSEVVDKHLVDQVIEFAMRAQGANDLAAVIQRRLRSLLQGFDIAGQMVRQPSVVTVRVFDLLSLVIYVHVFQRKFTDGAAVATLAPYARQVAALSRMGTVQLAERYIETVVANVFRGAAVVTDVVRRLYYDSVCENDLPLPNFAICPGFVEYSDTSSSNPRFTGWASDEHGPVYGFSNKLPGVMPVDIKPIPTSRSVSSDVSDATMQSLIATGEAFVAHSGLQYEQSRSLLQVACGVVGAVRSLLFQHDPEVVADVGQTLISPMIVQDGGATYPVKRDAHLFVATPQKPPLQVKSEKVDALVNRIASDQDAMISQVKYADYADNEIVFQGGKPVFTPGPKADDPAAYLFAGLKMIFPETYTVNTEYYETEKALNNWEVVCKSIRTKIDVSRLEMGKPEMYFAPKLRGHIQPSVKNGLVNTLMTVIKRNNNTPANADPLDQKFLWDEAWKALCAVFYLPGAIGTIREFPSIAPTLESVRAWVSALDDVKRQRLLDQPEGYMLSDLIEGANNNQMMLKSKLKPVMDASYATAVKQPQSIQYDATGKTIAVFSPVINQVVRREQTVLRPEVLILQRKSPEDVIQFLNKFDWRDNEKGKRRYIEIDFEMYDKSQTVVLADMYLRTLAEFGVLPQYTSFIQDVQHYRRASAVKAGVSTVLADQNPSGAAFTLDRNNRCNMLATAEKLYQIRGNIEFIILMGDDVIIAVRGNVDISSWEVDLSRKFNLALKAMLHEHGYICSMDIVHLPGGGSTVVADPIKRALAFMDVSANDESLFFERFESYGDNMKGVDDMCVQNYLAHAIPSRLKGVLPTITPDAVLCLLKAHSRLMSDFEAFRGMFATDKIVRYF